MRPASNDQLRLIKDFWSHYGTQPHFRMINTTLVKKDILSIISRLEASESKLNSLHTPYPVDENTTTK